MLHFIWKSRSQSLEGEWGGPESKLVEVQCEVSTVGDDLGGAMSSADVGLLCFIRSQVNAAVYQETLEHFVLPSADRLYGDAGFLFQQDLASAHSANATTNCSADHHTTVLDWPANWPGLNPTEDLWGVVKRKMRNTQPTIQMSWRLLSEQAELQ